MPAARNDLTQGVWSKLLLLAAALALMTGSASAQNNPLMPGISLGKEQKRQLTPEEQEREKQIDNDYKAATNKIPDQQAADPWTGVRPTPTVKRQFKDESLTPWHRDSFNGH
jgi:hypothetical protein